MPPRYVLAVDMVRHADRKVLLVSVACDSICGNEHSDDRGMLRMNPVVASTPYPQGTGMARCNRTQRIFLNSTFVETLVIGQLRTSHACSPSCAEAAN
jgi:hypothetical protein